MSLAFAAPALGQKLGVAGNTVTVSNSGGGFGPTALSISSGGIVDDLTGVPTSGTLDLPIFDFTLEQNSVGDGTYTFSAGFILDDENSGRRLEISIPLVSMTFTGGVLSGSVPSSQSVTVLGRSADSVTQVSTTVSNNFAGFNGSSLSFNADNQLALISAQGGIFADIITTIDTASSGNYSYAVFLKQTGGPANVRFGTGATASFTQFPCTDGSAFILVGSTLASTYNGAEGLQGQLKFAGSTGSLAPGDPALFTASACAVFGGGGGGGGGGGTTPPPPVTDNSVTANSELINDLQTLVIPADGEISDALASEIDSALESTEALTDTLVSDLESGSITVTSALSIVNTLNSALELAGTAIQNDGNLNFNTLTGIVSGIGGVLDALDSNSPLSASLLTQVRSTVLTTLTRIGDLTTAGTSSSNTRLLMRAASEMVNAAFRLGVDLDSTLTAGVRSLSESNLQKSIAGIGSANGRGDTAFGDSATTQNRLRNDHTLLSKVLDVVKIPLTGNRPLNQVTTKASITSRGVSDSGADRLTEDLTQYVNTTGLTVEVDGTTTTVNDLVTSAFSGGGAVTIDDDTGQVTVATGSGTVKAFVTDVSLVPDSVPSGTFPQPDGTLVNISNGIAITLAPSPADPVEFVGAIEFAGGGNITTDILDNGVLSLTDLTSGAKFIATFSFDPVDSGAPVADTSFTFPSGDPAALDYEFTITFEDGTIQSILPIISDPSFFDSVSAVGFGLETDRSTGVIVIDEFRFRPDYFLRPLNSFDILYRIANQDAFGVAYRASDNNGDGITDYDVITARGVQTVFGLP